MKKLLLIALTALVIFTFIACGDDDSNDADLMPAYTVTIMSPNTDDKFVGDTIHIHVDFAEKNGGTVHHVKVRIYDKVTGAEIYNQPDDAHVHAESGMFGYHDDLALNVDEHTDWVLEAKVWGHEAGMAEVVERVEFHVHPK